MNKNKTDDGDASILKKVKQLHTKNGGKLLSH